MSDLWAMRGIKKMLMDKRLHKPRLKHRSYQLKSRSWMRQLTAKGNRIERLESERDEYHNAVIGMSTMLKNHEWANLLSANDSIAELDVQITNLHDELSRERQGSLDCDDIKKLKLALSWMGCSTPESLEECGALQKRLVRDLIRAVLRQKDAMTRGSAA